SLRAQHAALHPPRLQEVAELLIVLVAFLLIAFSARGRRGAERAFVIAVLFLFPGLASRGPAGLSERGLAGGVGVLVFGRERFGKGDARKQHQKSERKTR